MMDIDRCFGANSRMWREVAKRLSDQALAFADNGDVAQAMSLAAAADACRWQATGEGDSVSLKDILKVMQS